MRRMARYGKGKVGSGRGFAVVDEWFFTSERGVRRFGYTEA